MESIKTQNEGKKRKRYHKTSFRVQQCRKVGIYKNIRRIFYKKKGMHCRDGSSMDCLIVMKTPYSTEFLQTFSTKQV